MVCLLETGWSRPPPVVLMSTLTYQATVLVKVRAGDMDFMRWMMVRKVA